MSRRSVPHTLFTIEQGAHLHGFDQPAERRHSTGQLLDALSAALKSQPQIN